MNGAGSHRAGACRVEGSGSVVFVQIDVQVGRAKADRCQIDRAVSVQISCCDCARIGSARVVHRVAVLRCVGCQANRDVVAAAVDGCKIQVSVFVKVGVNEKVFIVAEALNLGV